MTMQPDERVRVWAERLEQHIGDLEAWCHFSGLLPADGLDDIIDRLDALRHDMMEAVA
jgi:hypothetical protein